MGAIIALLLLLFAFVSIPLLITMIYKYFYDNHVNKSLQSQTPMKKWFSPLSLFVVLLVAEFLIMIGAGMMLRFNTSDEMTIMEADGSSYHTMTREEFDETILKEMDGGDVAGYQMRDYSQEDISCQVYKNTNDDLLPAYVICVTYTGAGELGCYDLSIAYGDAETAEMSDFEDPAEPSVYVVINSNLLDAENIEFMCHLYAGQMDTYQTGDLGTLNMPEAEETIAFVLP